MDVIANKMKNILKIIGLQEIRTQSFKTLELEFLVWLIKCT